MQHLFHIVQGSPIKVAIIYCEMIPWLMNRTVNLWVGLGIS